MKKTVLAVILLVCLIGQTAAAVSEKVLTRAIDIIGEQESNHNYTLVGVDTNGKISAGFMQWNAGRAVSLVKKAIALSGKNIAFDGTLSISDKSWVKELISSDAGRKAQDAMARSDVSGYIQKAMDLGIKDPNALCYYADIAHQVGSGAITKYHKLAAQKAGSYEKVTLEHMYQAALNYATHTKARRTRVYKILKDNPISDTTAQKEKDKDKETKVSGTKVKKVTISPSGAQKLYMNESLTLKAKFSPEGASDDLVWKTSNKKIATVKNGVVTPVKAGKCYIGVKTKGGKSAKVKVTVCNIPVEKISLSGKTTMTKGEIQKLSVSVSPSGAVTKYKWKSSNPKVVKVNQKGQIKAVKPGKAVIYCKEKGGKMAQITVEVQK